MRRWPALGNMTRRKPWGLGARFGESASQIQPRIVRDEIVRLHFSWIGALDRLFRSGLASVWARWTPSIFLHPSRYQPKTRCRLGNGRWLITCISSCGGLSGRCAGLRFLATPEGLHDAHLLTAIGAWLAQCERGDLGGWRVILFGGLRAEQGPRLCDISLSPGTGEQSIVADAVEPVHCPAGHVHMPERGGAHG